MEQLACGLGAQMPLEKWRQSAVSPCRRCRAARTLVRAVSALLGIGGQGLAFWPGRDLIATQPLDVDRPRRHSWRRPGGARSGCQFFTLPTGALAETQAIFRVPASRYPGWALVIIEGAVGAVRILVVASPNAVGGQADGVIEHGFRAVGSRRTGLPRDSQMSTVTDGAVMLAMVTLLMVPCCTGALMRLQLKP